MTKFGHTVRVGEWRTEGAERFGVHLQWPDENPKLCGWSTEVARYARREDAEAHAEVLRAVLAWDPSVPDGLPTRYNEE